MSLLLGAFTMGLILSLLSLGMLISFRMIRFTDITVDGSITLGASVAAVAISRGMNPWLSTALAVLAGGAAGSITGLLHTKFKIQELLSGILMMTALYSINLRIMGRSNIPLLSVPTVSKGLESGLMVLNGGAERMVLAGWTVSTGDVASFLSSLAICVVVGLAFRFLMLTDLGTGLRAAGHNPQMARAQGLDNQRMIVLSLAISNGLVAMAGALLAQYQGFADVQMGIGMMVWGLASIIIGEALAGKVSIGLAITATIMGTVLFRLLIAIALRWGLNPSDLKLVTAFFVFAALIAPALFGSLRARLSQGARHA